MHTVGEMKEYLKDMKVKGYSGKSKAQLEIMVERCKADHTPEMFIQKVISSPKFKAGAMTKAGARHGERPLEYAKDVLAHPEKHDLTTRRRAQFLINIQKKK
jgi:hypothetical protein